MNNKLYSQVLKSGLKKPNNIDISDIPKVVTKPVINSSKPKYATISELEKYSNLFNIYELLSIVQKDYGQTNAPIARRKTQRINQVQNRLATVTGQTSSIVLCLNENIILQILHEYKDQNHYNVLEMISFR